MNDLLFGGVPARRGFTLIELTMVIVIIAIIIAIGLPSLTRSRMAANETGAIGALRAIITAEEQYKTSSDGQSYAHPLDLYFDRNDKMGDALDWTVKEPPYITENLAWGHASSYMIADFEWDRDGYKCSMFPVDAVYVDPPGELVSKLGKKSFWLDASGTIRYETDMNTPISSTSPPLQ